MDNIQGFSILDYDLLRFLKKELARNYKNLTGIIKNKELMDDYDFMIEFINNDNNGYCVVQYASERLRDNENIVLAAVRKNGRNLDFASERLRDTEAVVLAAVKYDYGMLKSASERLRNDFEFVKECIIERFLLSSINLLEHSEEFKNKLKNYKPYFSKNDG